VLAPCCFFKMQPALGDPLLNGVVVAFLGTSRWPPPGPVQLVVQQMPDMPWVAQSDTGVQAGHAPEPGADGPPTHTFEAVAADVRVLNPALINSTYLSTMVATSQ
jgi:hypothetical protein